MVGNLFLKHYIIFENYFYQSEDAAIWKRMVLSKVDMLDKHLKGKSVLSIGTEPTHLVSYAMIKMKRGAKSLYSNQCSLIFYPSTSRANEAVNMC